MKIEHLDEGVGRIVKGVNTTPDVGVDQTRIEAAKFGNKVDKDGRPPTLSKKVKGKSTNVLFNLGLAESKKKVQEAFDNPYPITWEYLKPTGPSSGIAKLDDGSALDIHISEDPAGIYEIEFARGQSKKNMGRSGQGDEFRIFATVQTAMIEWWKQLDKTSAKKITFYANKEDGNRARLYKRFLTMWGDKSEWDIEVNANAKPGLVSYTLTNPTPDNPKNDKKTFMQRVFGKKETVENFAKAKKELPRYTAMEWAIIEGGHSLEDIEPQPKKPGRIFAALENVYEDAPETSLRPQLRPDSVTTDEPASSLAPASSPRPRLRPEFKPNIHERLIIRNGKVRGMSDEEIAAMLAQIRVETGDFQYMTELGDAEYFQMYDPQYAPRKAAALGNTQSGDGYKYRGRGYLQITGRYNYEQASKQMPGGFTDFVESPDLVATPNIAVQLAFHYWNKRTQPNVNNWNDVRSVTKTINPGLRHLSQRQAAYDDYKVKMRMLA